MPWVVKFLARVTPSIHPRDRVAAPKYSYPLGLSEKYLKESKS